MIIGDLISFMYPAVHQQQTRAHDRNPHVFVLHPNWRGKVHGLNLNYLTADEINVLRMIIDPFFEMKFRSSLQRRNAQAFNEMEKIITSTGPNRNAKLNNPQAFYNGIIKPFISVRGYDPYRIYTPSKMTGVRVIQKAAKFTGEESLLKFKQEKEELGRAVKQALEKAKTPDEQRKAKDLQAKLDHATSMSQRKSILTMFSDFIRARRGPRF
jgi:hypothetical protein